MTNSAGARPEAAVPDAGAEQDQPTVLLVQDDEDRSVLQAAQADVPAAK